MPIEKIKIGLEVHMQLNTGKLFCRCGQNTGENRNYFQFTRLLRPTLSELGKVDIAAEYETERDRIFTYDATDNTCLVEYDEEPPHEMDDDAVKASVIISLALHCDTVENISTMRKVVVDGSNTSGFQRTSIVGFNGYLDTRRGRVRISTVCLEEDSARKVEGNSSDVTYSLDRLGIPLIEVSTQPDIVDEDHAVEVAEKIGSIGMLSGYARREVDAIRQDVNMSMGMGRVEIKGVQKLSLIRDLIKYEKKRQESILRGIEVVGKRSSGKKTDVEFTDMSSIFEDSSSIIIRSGFKAGNRVYCSLLPYFAGTLKNGDLRIGKEISDVVKAFGLGGIFHSDELPAYGIEEGKINTVYSKLGKGQDDAVLILSSPSSKIKVITSAINNRINKLMSLDLAETRGPRDDGVTFFLRPLPGKDRMYPETDIPIKHISAETMDFCRKNIPKEEVDLQKELTEIYGISEQDATVLIKSGNMMKFRRVADSYKDARSVARLLLLKIPEIREKLGKEPDESQIMDVLKISSRENWSRFVMEKAVEISTVSGLKGDDLKAEIEKQIMSEEEIAAFISSGLKDGTLTEKNIIPSISRSSEKIVDPTMALSIFKQMTKQKHDM
ncbi:Glu-tRNA(Gln) amidotransferase subunit GatE [Oxyplasma meridianum]|uniref:Glutamyl-tRNA(Gln) amidotransferase subunit E n=1 Tax=Oxyplasma meridianum TaxID=3073602 RepID=A0AAX4NGG5_9ARCH